MNGNPMIGSATQAAFRAGYSSGDPIGSEAPRGKSLEKRMGRYDGGFTPSEQRLKSQLMKQFMKHGGEGPGGNSAAYQEGWERTFGKKSTPDVGTLASFNELAKEMTGDWLQQIHKPDGEWERWLSSGDSDPYREGWERTFGSKEPEEATQDELELEYWMRHTADEWFSSLNRDPYRANYDRIDWSK